MTNHKKQQSIMVIILFLLLPLHSALSFAELKDVSVHGLGNVQGYRRAVRDKTIIEAYAKLSGDTEITPDQLRIFAEGKTTVFHQCKNAEEYAFCTYETSVNAWEDTAKAYPFTVQLYTDTQTIADSVPMQITYDALPPTLIINTVTQQNNTVVFAVQGEDRACLLQGCEGACAGLKSIGIDGNMHNLSGCTFFQHIPLLATGNGIKTYKLTVTDVFNQATTAEQEFFVDTTDPRIEKTVFFLTDGQPIHAIGEEGIRAAWVVVTIQEHSLADVWGDLSQLNKIPEFSEKYRHSKADCERMAADQFQCTWRDIYILPEKQTLILPITATDDTGKQTTTDISVQLPLDTDKPHITKITTSGCTPTVCYLSLANNTIQADIEEKDTGFSPFTYENGQPLYRVGIQGLGLGTLDTHTLWANNCSGKGNNWACFWNNAPAQGPHLRQFRIAIPALSTDDAGNTFTGETEKQIIIDAVAPEVIEANVSSDQEQIHEDAQLIFSARIKDDSPIHAQIFHEQITGIKEPATVHCQLQEDKMHVCMWQSGKLLPAKNAQIMVVFTDGGGNSAKQVIPITVFKIEKEKKNYWQVAGKPLSMPSAIERETLSLEQRVYFQVPLSGPANAKIIDGGVTACTENTGFSTVRIVSAAEHELMLQATIGPLPASEDTQVKATCTAFVITVLDNEQLAQPQEIALHLALPLVSTLAGIDSAIQKKIDDAKNWDLYGLRKITKPLEQFYKIAEQICTGLSLASQSLGQGALGTYRALSSVGSRGISMSQGIAVAAQANNQLFKEGYKYCQYLSCDKTMWKGPYENIIKEPSFSKERHLGATAWPQNPKENLFLSMATGCLPGIFYNLNKYKQFQCIYVDCLQNQVPQGVPMQYCTNQHEYLKCRFFYGQMFDLIPFAHFVKRMALTMKTIFANPLSFVFGAGTFACEQQYAGLGANSIFCAAARTIPQALSTIDQLKQFGMLQQDITRQQNAPNICAKVGMDS